MNVKEFLPGNESVQLAYCDYIAEVISKELKELDTHYYRLLSSVGRPCWDMAPEGYMVSTKKTILVEDRSGKKYRITVEEV